MAKEERKVGLFDFVNDISKSKHYLLDDDTKTVYNEFMVNKAFSQHLDTILLANEMNKRGGIGKIFHHDFLFYSVDSKSRYGKWAKKGDMDDDVIDYLKSKYKINNDRALEYMNLMSSEDKDEIRDKIKSKIGKVK